MRRIAEFLERYDSADLAGLGPETREELRRMARYAYERYGWKTIVHEGKASSGHAKSSQHYLGRAVDLHLVDAAGKVVPLFDQFILAIRFDWNGMGLYPFWNNPGLHLDTRPEGKLGEASLWWRDESGKYQAIESRFLPVLFRTGEEDNPIEEVIGLNTKKWYQSKTIWTGLAAVVSAVGGVATGELSLASGLQMAFTGLVAIFLRTGVEGVKKAG